MSTVREKIGMKIRKFRKERELTQEKLSELARIDYSYMNLIENGKRNPSLKIMIKIAHALHVRLDDLTRV